MFHRSPLFVICFGDGRHPVDVKKYLNFSSSQKLLKLSPFNHLKKTLRLNDLVFLKQTHSSMGSVVFSSSSLITSAPFSKDGDFLITNLKKTGIGVLTADCLPIIILDSFNNACSIIHAGWKGTQEKIVLKALEKMNTTFGTNPKDVEVFFGPSAKACCYKVDKSFIQPFEKFSFLDKIIIYKKSAPFFNLPLF